MKLLFGDCLLSPLENYLLEKNITYENGKEKSMISYIFDYRYLLQLLKSKRKIQYITNLFTQKTIS